MSLEIAIQQNTEALQVLIGLLKSGNVPAPVAPVETPTATTKAEKTAKPKKEIAAPVETPTDETEMKSIFPKGEESAAASEESRKVTREMITTSVLALVKKDRPTAVQILADFGVQNAKHLKDDQIVACYDKLQAAINGN